MKISFIINMKIIVFTKLSYRPYEPKSGSTFVVNAYKHLAGVGNSLLHWDKT